MVFTFIQKNSLKMFNLISLRYLYFYLKKKIFFFFKYPKGVKFLSNKNKNIFKDILLNISHEKIIIKKSYKEYFPINTNLIDLKCYTVYFRNSKKYFFCNFYIFDGLYFFYEKNPKRYFLKDTYKFNDNLIDFFDIKKLNINNFSHKFHKLPQKIKYLDKPIINISTYNNNSFFHWLFHPGLLTISHLNKSYLDQLDNFYFYIGPIKKIPKYVNDTLDILGIQNRQIIKYPCTSNLIISTFQVFKYDIVSKKHINFLRNTFLNKSHINSVHKSNFEKIFIGRKNNNRSIINYKNFYNYLLSNGYKIFYLEDYHLKFQVSLFQNAKKIISIHGAGLANLAFCNPNTNVIEIFPANRINTYMISISIINKLNYSMFRVKKNLIDKNYNIYIDIPKFDYFMKSKI